MTNYLKQNGDDGGMKKGFDNLKDHQSNEINRELVRLVLSLSANIYALQLKKIRDRSIYDSLISLHNKCWRMEKELQNEFHLTANTLTEDDVLSERRMCQRAEGLFTLWALIANLRQGLRHDLLIEDDEVS